MQQRIIDYIKIEIFTKYYIIIQKLLEKQL